MRVKFSSLALAGAAFLAGCGDSPGPVPVPVMLVVPNGGRYQAALVGYSEQGCEAALSEPVGALESAATLSYLSEGRVDLSASRIWPYGPVSLQPGSASDAVERTAWRGATEVRAARGGCTLTASILLRYYPLDAERGNLSVQLRWAAAAAGCPLRLPCQDTATWSMSYYP